MMADKADETLKMIPLAPADHKYVLYHEDLERPDLSFSYLRRETFRTWRGLMLRILTCRTAFGRGGLSLFDRIDRLGPQRE